jgi:hypothetical protein
MGGADGSATHELRAGAVAEDKLRQSAYLALQNLSCEFCAGVLTVRGLLPSYYLKQVALATVATVAGVERIDDQVEIVPGVRPR